MESSMQTGEPKNAVEMQHHDQEKDAEKGSDGGNGNFGGPNHGGIDRLKLSRGLLSFRSRKLLGSLSKISSSSGVNQVVDPPAGLGAEAQGLSQSRGGLVGKEVASVELSKPVNPNHRKLWDPRRVESEAAEARAKLAQQRARRKKKQQQHQDVQREKERTEADDQVQEGKAPEVQNGSLKESLDESMKGSLPPRLRLLEAFYEGLEAASSLLRIRHQMCTFRAVRKVVESMSKRRFLMKHLAQMKHLFSEIMQLDYVRYQDPDSWGEKWDLRITLLPLPSDFAQIHTRSPMKGSAGQTGATIRRRKEFRTRLVNFATSNSEDSELPQAPLPSRPLGGSSQQRPSSPNRHLVSSHLKSEDFEPSEEEFAARARSTTEEKEGATSAFVESSLPDLGAKDFEFSIVKPSTGGHVARPPSDRTSHFPAPFSPHFSVPRAPGDSVSSKATAAVMPSSGSHFQDSFRPFFSLKPPQAERAADSSCEDKNHSAATPPEFLSCSDQQTDPVSDSAAISEEPVPPKFSGPLSSSSLDFATSRSDEPSPAHPMPRHHLYQSSCHFPPCTPDATVVGSALPQAPKQDRSGHPLLSPSTRTEASPILGFVTPSETPNLTRYTTQKVESRSQLSPQKTQGVMRSLRFESPAKSVISSKPMEDFAKPANPNISAKAVESSPRAPSSATSHDPPTSGHSMPSTPCTPAQIFSSKPRTMLDVTPITPLTPGTPLTPPALQGSSDDGSLAKNLASRSLQFSTPGKSIRGDEVTTNAQTWGKLDIGTSQTGCISSSSPQKTYGSSSPHLAARVGELKSPAKTSRLKEILCSPPKRTKLCLASHARLIEGDELRFHDPANFVPREDDSEAASCSGLDAAGRQAWPVEATQSSPSKFVNDCIKFTAVSPSKCTSASPLSTSASPSQFAGASPSRLTSASPSKLTGASPLRLTSASPSKFNSASPLKSFCASPSKLASVSPSKISSLSCSDDMRRLSKSDLDIIQCLPPELVQSVQEKERKLKDESRRELAKQRRRQQMIGGVPKLFNQLRLLFQSMNRSVLPRQELVKSILSSHPDITDKGEVEERLQLVTELAPDYLTTLHSQSGELLYRIDKRANVVQIQRRLSASC